MSNASEGWSEYWVQEGAGGEVFVNAKGEKHPALAAFWSSVFEPLTEGAAVIDIASGAGSIFGQLPADHGLELYAADISAEALQLLAERIPGVKVVECPADDIPLDDGRFDLVVSQFGIEYAGADAFAESARLVAPGGSLTALTHIRGGYVDARNKAQLEEARLVSETGFIDRCIELTEAEFSKDPDRIRQAESAIDPAATQIREAVGRCPQGVHAYLFAGFKQLYDRRWQYDMSDITGWLDGMRGEVDKAVMRLSHMRSAAMSADDMQSIRARLDTAGLIEVRIEEFLTPGNDEAVAWQIRATRPGE